MEELVKVWSSMPPEARGALELWLASAGLALARLVINRYVPAGRARAWIEAVDWLAHIAAGNSRALGQRVAPDPKRNSVRP